MLQRSKHTHTRATKVLPAHTCAAKVISAHTACRKGHTSTHTCCKGHTKVLPAHTCVAKVKKAHTHATKVIPVNTCAARVIPAHTRAAKITSVYTRATPSYVTKLVATNVNYPVALHGLNMANTSVSSIKCPILCYISKIRLFSVISSPCFPRLHLFVSKHSIIVVLMNSEIEI